MPETTPISYKRRSTAQKKSTLGGDKLQMPCIGRMEEAYDILGLTETKLATSKVEYSNTCKTYLIDMKPIKL